MASWQRQGHAKCQGAQDERAERRHGGRVADAGPRRNARGFTLDALAPEAGVPDRRTSVTRLVPALRRIAGEALCLPVCFLFARHLRFDAADPAWPDRDRLVVDPALAPLGACLAELAGMPPGSFEAPGQAFGLGVGCALAERKLAARFGRSLVDHRSWILAPGDELASGAVQEAAWLAGSWRLARLTAIVSVAAVDAPGLAGFAASGWSVRRIDAADGSDVAAAVSAALRAQRPTLIACVRTARPGTGRHQPSLDDLSIDSTKGWQIAGRRSAGVRRAWLKRLARHGSRQDFEQAAGGRLPAGWHAAFYEPGPLLPQGQTVVSTSATLAGATVRLAAAVPEVVRIPADAWPRPAGGPLESTPGLEMPACLAQGLSGVAAGLALHGGTIPLAKFRLAEAESVRSALRGAAASGLRLVTFLVEPDAPCPAGGQRASLRAMRNLCVMRPADASEALECAELALRRSTAPTVMLISEVPGPLLADRPSRTRCSKGGYVLLEASARRAVTLIASGPELHLAVAASRLLAAEGVCAAVVSLPCWSIFARQDPTWQDSVLGDAPRVAIEAGSGFGWERWLRQDGLFIGTDQMQGVPWTVAQPEGAARRICDLVLRQQGSLPTV